MNDMKTKKYKGFLFRSEDELSDAQADALLLLLQQVPERPSGALSGRYGVIAGQVPGFGQVAVKGYRRGGFLRFLLNRRYLAFGKSRAEQEFEFLKKASEIGCRVPQPYVSISQGWPLERTWLVMEAVENHRTLAEVSQENDSELYGLLPAVGENILKLISHKIFHVDLHPGNVLVAGDAQIYLIDFDKAHVFKGHPTLLRDKYLCRWRRAVIKHELPEVLSELLSAELRRKVHRHV